LPGDDFDTTSHLNVAGGPELAFHTAVASANDVVRSNAASPTTLAGKRDELHECHEQEVGHSDRNHRNDGNEETRHMTEGGGGASNLFSIPQPSM